MADTEDQWQERATAAAIAAARNIVLGDNAAVNKNTPVGRLSETEWGWIVAAILFAWISTRAEQATVEEIDSEQAIRLTGLDRNPWDAGAIAAILPSLADVKIDWSKPLADWPRETAICVLSGDQQTSCPSTSMSTGSPAWSTFRMWMAYLGPAPVL